MAGTVSAMAETESVENKALHVIHNYKGFIAGVFSGVTKLAVTIQPDTSNHTNQVPQVGHPFDTVKVRLQTTDRTRFSGPLQCFLQTVRNEGVFGLYKGATPPLVGWMFMDSVMLGSMTLYRRLLSEHIYPAPPPPPPPPPLLTAAPGPLSVEARTAKIPFSHLPTSAHCVAGLMAGGTVSFVAAPFEHIKARLQIQYAADKADRRYRGPMDCVRKIYKYHGVRGVYRGLGATLIFRSQFWALWGSYDVLSHYFRRRTDWSEPTINFWAGGLGGQLFWILAYPSDVVKQRIMTDPMGGGLGDGQRQFARWRDAARAVFRESGWKGYWRGFVPCFFRAFPTNAMAIVAFEGVMRTLP